jgi:ketosteroid isomerase-like protein
MRPIRLARPVLRIALLLPAAAAFAQDETVTLKRQTQQLVDAVSRGDAEIWDLYLDPAVRYVDETGTVLTKKQMVDGTRPLPPGVSGNIRVTDFDAVVHGDVGVATYVDEETETFHGHELHCRYRTTDTWKKTEDGWRLIAAQVLALREDPPSIALSAAQRDEYRGTYVLAPGIAYEIRAAGSGLSGQQSGRMAETLLAEAPDVLFVPGKPRYRYVFLRGADGRITGFAQRREASDLVWKREAAKPAP